MSSFLAVGGMKLLMGEEEILCPSGTVSCGSCGITLDIEEGDDPDLVNEDCVICGFYVLEGPREGLGSE